ncbi:unnamed protein product [Oppiella nova]|uniref:Ras-associating domain-containing protein n=1 Tax=Oppiella nova TaxID=334625 RepID=A0A7R9LHF3_9ACAR|nr:unnamed protein product [Oppiella nova]CAG2162982.1 unnamed protein product [Oppiella nova]
MDTDGILQTHEMLCTRDSRIDNRGKGQGGEMQYDNPDLIRSIIEAKDREGKCNTTIQISYGGDKYTLLKVTNRCTTTDIIQLAHHILKCEGPVGDYQLWVKTSRDDTPYPLIGHEYPFAIKMNFVRDLLHRSNLDLQNFNNIAADNKCIFILRKSCPKTTGSLLENSSKKAKPKRRPINWPFKKILTSGGGGHGGDLSLDSGISTSEPSTPTKGKLFGQHLDLICNEDSLPQPIMLMLKELYQKGPYTVGIFRKSANARVCKEFRAKLESESEPNIGEVPVIVIANTCDPSPTVYSRPSSTPNGLKRSVYPIIMSVGNGCNGYSNGSRHSH